MKPKMRKLTYAMFVVAVIITACQPKTKSVPFDAATAKQQVTGILDSIYLAYNAKDTTQFMSLLTDDGLYLGTDPKEFWDKQTYSGLMNKKIADIASAKLTVDKREIHFSKNGSSAIVVDQFFMDWSKKIPVRHILHFYNMDNKWKCDFASLTIIPSNEDLFKIAQAVK
jgi:ketosteroid isomerase-like protein